MAGSQAEGQAGRISSPEQLDDYLHVTNPRVWMLLAAVALIVVGLMFWGASATVESYAIGTVQASGGELVATFENRSDGEKVQVGMKMEVAGQVTPVLAVGTDGYGNVVASARSAIPDGTYEARVGYDTTQVISMLFN